MTREIEARLKLSAVDRTANAFKSVSGRMAAFEAKARAMERATTAFAQRRRIEEKAALLTSKYHAAQVAGTLAAVSRYAAPAVAGLGAGASYKSFATFDRQLTNIGVTADATAEEIAGAGRAVREISHDSAMPLAKTIEGLDSLVAAGRKMPEALDFLPAVVKTAQATAAEVVDIARSADAMGASFKIAGREMQQAFDISAYLGKEGKFEMKDQARYLPSIAPLAATRGLLGLDGLTRVGAALQVIRMNSGTAEEAAASMSDVLGKLDANETATRFKKSFGIDLPKALAKGRKEGRNTLDTFIEISRRAIHGDMELTNKIFQDKEARRGLTALLQHYDEYQRLIGAASNAAGTVAADAAKKTADAQAALDRLSNSATNAAVSVGKLLDRMGASTALETFSRLVDFDSEKLGSVVDRLNGKQPGSPVEAAVGDRLRWLDTFAKVTNHFIDPKSPVERFDADRRAAGAEDARRLSKARAEVERIDKIRSRYGREPLPAVLQAQYDAARRTLDAPRDLGRRYPTTADRRAFFEADADAASETHRQRARMGLDRADLYALPRARPNDGAAAASAAMEGFNSEMRRQQRQAEAEAGAFMARMAAIFSRPLTANVTLVKPAPPTGRSFENGSFNGAP